MVNQCAACGNQFGDQEVCPQCGLPVKPPEPAIPAPEARPTAVDAPARSGRKWGSRLLVVLGTGVVVVALAVGGAFAATKLWSPGGVFGGPVALTVVGEPPSPTGNWSSGVREVWRVSGRHLDPVSEEYTTEFQDPAATTRKTWALTDLVGDTAVTYWAFDSSTGKIRWGAGDISYQDCAAEPLDGKGVCLASVKGSDGTWDEWTIALVDWEQGKPVARAKLSGLGFTDEPDSYWRLAVIDGDVVIADRRVDIVAGLQEMTIARISPDLKKVIWSSKNKGCEGWYFTANDFRLVHGALEVVNGFVLDWESGKSLLPDSVCGTFASDKALIGIAMAGGSAPPSLTAPDGTQIAVTQEVSGVHLVDALPAAPLKITDLDVPDMGVGTGNLSAFDPVTGAATWDRPAPIYVENYTSQRGLTALDKWSGLLSVDEGGFILVDSKSVMRIDAKTGEVKWRKFGEFGVNGPGRTADGTVLVGLDDDYLALDPESGATLWTSPATRSLTVVENLDGSESLFGFGDSGVFRLDPADRPTKALAAPPSVPACPDGMSAISWTQYSDGGVLLCHSDQRYQVVFPAHPDWQAAELTFTAGGHEVVFSNGVRVRVSLGGTVVYTDQSGQVATQTATQAWNNATGEVKVSVPKDLKICPAGSWPISLSTYAGGWLLVCGTGADAPTSMVLNDGSATTQLDSVVSRGGGYCGSGTIGTVCGYRSPALVTVTDPNGQITQHSADGNYFDGHGAGGVGHGTGSYGVEAPTDTAKDQVRYLTEILQKSAAGRSNLNEAVSHVRNCSDVAGAVTTIGGVISNRQELLDALDSTPVDAVPNGSSLVAKLRTALQLSLASDKVWLQWAQSEQANGCAEGEDSPSYKQVVTMNRDVATAKDEFVAAWNSQIAGTHNAPGFTTSEI